MTGGRWKMQINECLLWEAEDGREAWVNFWPGRNQAWICTDIHRSPSVPEQAVGFTPQALRRIADKIEELEILKRLEDE